jgi:signal transduction histidine kinase
MGAPGTASPASPDAKDRSVVRLFVTRVVVPVVALIVIWAALTGAAFGGALGNPHWLAVMAPGHRRIAEAGIVAGSGLLIAIVALALAGLFASRLSRELATLARNASLLADDQAPALVTRHTVMAETSTIAAALASLHDSAATAAAGEAGLRHGLRQILVSLGRRNQALVHRQLRIIDTLEQEATSSSELSGLFTLDHLTTRMRRHAESLSILAGEAPNRSWSGPVPVLDIMRAAAAEVEDYKRVGVVSDAREAISAPAVTDMIHLLAELIENATLFSPSSTRVEVRAEPVGNGFVVEVEDKGLGIPPEQLAEINDRLATPPDIHVADADRLGLFVAAQLAARHGIGISLVPSAYRGTKAVVVIPAGIVVAGDAAAAAQAIAPQPGSGRDGAVAGRLNLRSPEVLAMAGAAATIPPVAGAPAADAAAPPASRRGLPRRVRPNDTAGSGTAGRTGAARTDTARTNTARANTARANTARANTARTDPDSPAPEEARSLAASLQSSWQRSRESDFPRQAGSAASGPLPQRPESHGPAPMTPGEEE